MEGKGLFSIGFLIIWRKTESYLRISLTYVNYINIASYQNCDRSTYLQLFSKCTEYPE